MSNSLGVVLQTRTSSGHDGTIGALLTGALLSMVLWGITCIQTFDYFLNNKDGFLQRSMVTLLWGIDSFSSAMNAYTIYFYAITNFANPTALEKPTWTISAQPVVTGITNVIVRTMFVRRIYILSKNKPLVIWIMTLSIADFVIATILSIEGFHGAVFGKSKSLSTLLYLCFAFSITVESSVAISLCWILHVSRTGFRRTETMINVLMVYVLNTGLLVAIDATLSLITFLTLPETLVSFVFLILLGKLYLNAYLASLNARGKLREQDTITSLRMSRLDLSRSRAQLEFSQNTKLPSELSGSSRTQNMAISFRTSIERHVDDYEVEKSV